MFAFLSISVSSSIRVFCFRLSLIWDTWRRWTWCLVYACLLSLSHLH